MAPRLPCPAPDENELDTALETSAHGQHTASPAGQHSEAEVTYQLTALTGPANRKLREFADGYPAYLQSWQDAITAWIYAPGTSPGHHGTRPQLASGKSARGRAG